MKINSKYRLEMAISNDAGKCSFLNVVESHKGLSPEAEQTENLLDGRPGFVVASNGRILAVVPCILEKGDVIGMVRGDLLVLARRFRKKRNDVELRIRLGRRRVKFGSSDAIFPRLDIKLDSRYPNTNGVVPDAQLEQRREAITHIGLSPKLLISLLTAMGLPEQARFQFDGNSSPVVVRDGEKRNLMGLIMPMRGE